MIDEKALGYPVESLRQVPPGKYRVQAVLHKYETFHRADGHTVKLPMDRGEGQQWDRAPGNLYSTPQDVTIEPGRRAPRTIAVTLDKVIPPIPEPADDQVHQARADPERAAHEVLGPAHAPRRPRPAARGLRRASRGALSRWSSSTATSPRPSAASAKSRPDPNLKPEYSERFHLHGYNRTEQELAHQFYKEWTGPTIRA